MIEKKLYEVFTTANFPKALYTNIIDSLDLDDMLPEYYKLMQVRLVDHCEDKDGVYIITRKKARGVLGRCFNVPKAFQLSVLGELRQQNIVSFIDKRNIIVTNL